MAKEKKSNGKSVNKIVIIIVALLVIGVGVFGGVYFALSNSGDKAEKPIEEAYYELGEIFVNLNDESGKKYVKLTATLTYDSKNKDLVKEIETKSIALKDAAVFYFKSLKTEDFNSEKEVDLKKNLVDKLNYNLKDGLILDVKFNELLIQ